MKIYIAGPMTGIPEHNFPAFNEAATLIRALGHEIINPAEMDGPDFDHNNPAPWQAYLKRDLVLLVNCDAIYLLPGWDSSRGAGLEYQVAITLGLKAYHNIDHIEDINHG